MPYSLLEAKPIAELCTVVDCEHKTAPYVEYSDYLVVRTSNVRNGQLLMKSMKFTTKDGFTEWTQRAIPEFGDVLFTREAPAGESCLVPKDKKVCMGQRMVMLRPNKNKVDPIFLSMILNTERTKSDIYRLSIGSTVSRINIADIKKLKIAFPPLSEQQKIAKILSTWDKAIGTTEALIDNSKQQKKALMQQLLTGKKRFTGFEGEWTKSSLQDLVSITYGKSPKGIFCDKGKYEIIGTGGVTGRTNEILCKEAAVIIGRKGTIDKPRLLSSPFWAIDTTFYCCPVFEDVDIIWFYYLVKTLNLRRYNEASGVPSLSRDNLYGIKVQKPKYKEQQKITAVLTNADKEIELLEKQLTDLKQEKKALMQQLLTGKRRVKVDDVEAA